jgi:hypothetical protein
MQRVVLNMGPWGLIAALAMATTMSCGTGIRDGESEFSMTKTIGPEGGQIVLQEATLDIPTLSLKDPETITLRRFWTIDHTGADSPVFEIQIPTPNIFNLDPQIGIVTSDAAAANPAATIGFLYPGISNEQWVPDTSKPFLACSPPTVCGPVQSDGFENPSGAVPPTTKLDFAIVTGCASNADCEINQTCSSLACQQCVEVTSCKTSAP